MKYFNEKINLNDIYFVFFIFIKLIIVKIYILITTKKLFFSDRS